MRRNNSWIGRLCSVTCLALLGFSGTVAQDRGQAAEEERGTRSGVEAAAILDNLQDAAADVRDSVASGGLNTISGQVKIIMQNGKARTDRSDVIVFLDRVPHGAAPPSRGVRPVLSQRDKAFEPKVLAITKGTTVRFPNEDTIFHNVFSLSKAKPLDLDVYPPGHSKAVRFDRTGWIKVYCNIHPKMVAHVIVLDNPYFAKTNARGAFTIPGLPDGEYKLRTWHEFGQEVRRIVRVSGGANQRLTLEVVEDKKRIPHKNKFGHPYKAKY